uniref:Integrin alpha-2 domain-containing protein n=1 Tax=Taeniopygia guttata TaxID=59729 RepID=A0A674HCI2_TAEGU
MSRLILGGRDIADPPLGWGSPLQVLGFRGSPGALGPPQTHPGPPKPPQSRCSGSLPGFGVPPWILGPSRYPGSPPLSGAAPGIWDRSRYPVPLPVFWVPPGIWDHSRYPVPLPVFGIVPAIWCPSRYFGSLPVSGVPPVIRCPSRYSGSFPLSGAPPGIRDRSRYPVPFPIFWVPPVIRCRSRYSASFPLSGAPPGTLGPSRYSGSFPLSRAAPGIRDHSRYPVPLPVLWVPPGIRDHSRYPVPLPVFWVPPVIRCPSRPRGLSRLRSRPAAPRGGVSGGFPGAAGGTGAGPGPPLGSSGAPPAGGGGGSAGMASSGCRRLPGLLRWLPGLFLWLPGLFPWLPGLLLWLPGLFPWLPGLLPWLPGLFPWLPAAAAFNLAGSSPVLKDGERGSLFGAAVALHRQLSPEPAGWLLVGAPQALALPGQGANRSGALFACPLSAEPTDCRRLPIDQGGDPQRESKENQWLGVSVRSQGPGGKVVTCAHRYEVRHRVRTPLETRDVIGRCFVLSQDLQERDELDGGEWRFCRGRPPGHERFGLCQQGLAAAFSPDRRYLLLGAPGTYNWKGLLFVTNVESATPDLRVFRTPQPGERVPGAAADVGHNSYLGFSVDSGPGLTRRQQLSFVSGAPRANHTGAVLILRRDGANLLRAEALLPGHQLSSAFGHALALLDLNSDGWMDLAVGAPHFFERQEEIGGAVYVYLNPEGRWDSATPVRLNGPRGSAFGTALCSAGDLDRDGFEDLAVGAPFDGAGKVFIYHGSALGIVTRPAQVLDGEAVGVSAFGYSLSGGLDVDGNLYPDLLVGSLSDTVVLYRARPVVHLSRDVSLLPPHIDLERSNCRHGRGVCVEVRACFSYTGPGNDSAPLELRYELEADGERRRRGLVPRGSFVAWGPETPETPEPRTSELGSRISGILELPRQRERRCVPATFRLHDGIRDKLRPIGLSLDFAIAGGHRAGHRGARGAALPPLPPVLSPRQPSSLRAEVHFLRQGCGDDQICQSHLELWPRFCARLGDSDFVPLPRDEDGTATFAVSEQKDVALEVRVTNEPSDPAEPQRDGDDAHQALLAATFPPELPYAGLRGDGHGDKVLCLANQNGSRVECELGNPLKRGAQVGAAPSPTPPDPSPTLPDPDPSPGPPPALTCAPPGAVLPHPQHLGHLHPHHGAGGAAGAVHHQRAAGAGAGGRPCPRGDRAAPGRDGVSQRGPLLKTPGSAALTVQWPLELPNGKWLLYPLSLELGTPPVPCSPPANPLRLALVRSGGPGGSWGCPGRSKGVQRDSEVSKGCPGMFGWCPGVSCGWPEVLRGVQRCPEMSRNVGGVARECPGVARGVLELSRGVLGVARGTQGCPGGARWCPGGPCPPPKPPLVPQEPPGQGDPPQEPPARPWSVPAGRRRRNVTLDCALGTARCRPFRCPLPSLERSELRARGRLWNGTFLEEFLGVQHLELIVRAEVSVTSPRGNVLIRDPVAQMSLSVHAEPGVAVPAVPWWVLPLAALLGLALLGLLVLALRKVRQSPCRDRERACRDMA